MHQLDPLFEAFSFSKVMKALYFKLMKFEDPLVVQSMYIFKVNLLTKQARTNELAEWWSRIRTTRT